MSLGMLHLLGDRVPEHVGWAPLRPRLYDRFAIVHRQGAVLSPATSLMVELVTTRLLAVETAARRQGRTRAPAAPRSSGVSGSGQ